MIITELNYCVVNVESFKASMQKIFNDIKVLFKRYNNNVSMQDANGEVILYNHSNIIPSRLGISTGVKLDVNEHVLLDIKDFDGNNIKYGRESGYIVLYIDDNGIYDSPICKVTFVPKDSTFCVSKFFGHLIEFN